MAEWLIRSIYGGRILERKLSLEDVKSWVAVQHPNSEMDWCEVGYEQPPQMYNVYQVIRGAKYPVCVVELTND